MIRHLAGQPVLLLPVVVLLLLLLPRITVSTSRSPALLTVEVRAPWPLPRGWRRLEMLEHVARERSTAEFWTAVEDETHTVLGGDLLVDVLLEAHVYAPALEAQRALSQALRRALPPPKGECRGSAWIALSTPRLGGAAATCDADEFRTLVRAKDSSTATCATDGLVMLDADRVHPESSSVVAGAGNATVVIVHGEPGTALFARLWAAALDALRGSSASEPMVLALRLVAETDAPVGHSTPLGGFTVTLDVKNTEYIAVNEDAKRSMAARDATKGGGDTVAGIVFSKLAARPDAAGKDLSQLRGALERETAKLKVWELRDLGMQAASEVRRSTEPLRALRGISHNLPSRARRLSNVEVDEAVREATRELHAGSNPTYTRNALYVNGVEAPTSLVPLLRLALRHVRAARLAHDAGVQDDARFRELRGRLLASDGGGAGAGTGRVDVRRRARGAVFFLNDLERDKMYADLPRDLKTLLRPATQLHSLARNLYTLIFCLDPVGRGSSSLQIARYLVQVGAPFKVGITLASKELGREYAEYVPPEDDTPEAALEAATPACGQDGPTSTTTTCDARCIARLFLQARLDYGLDAAVQIILALGDDPLSCAEAVETYAMTAAETKGAWSSSSFAESARAALGSKANPELERGVRLMARYVGALDLPMPCVTLNGIVIDVREDERIDSKIGQFVFTEQTHIAGLVRAQAIDPAEDILVQLLREAKPFYSTLAARSRWEYLPITYPSPVGDIAPLATRPSSSDDSAAPSSSATEPSLVSVLIPIWRSEDCRAVRLLSSIRGIEVKVFAATAAVPGANNRDAAASQNASPMTMCDDGLPVKRAPVSFARELAALRARQAPAGDRSIVIINGRVLMVDDAMRPRDIEALVDLEMRAIAKLALRDDERRLDRVQALMSVLGWIKNDPVLSGGGGGSKSSSGPPTHWPDALTVVVAPRRTDAANFSATQLDVVLVADPLDLWTQRGCAATELLWELGARVTIMQSPRIHTGELPPSNFFASSRSGTAAEFRADDGVPTGQLLTVKMGLPSSWIAYPKDLGGADPDNLLLEDPQHDAVSGSDKRSGLRAEYELAHTLVEGHMSLSGSSAPAAGMQVELVRHDGLDHADEADLVRETRGVMSTIVMHNLGYWQIKASPGFWRVRPVADTPFRFARGSSSSTSSSELVVDLSDFEPKPVEAEVESLGGDRSAVRRGQRGSTPQVAWKPSEDDVVHVFSLASGALYERFLRIMMLSVRKRTTGRIKFWLLENYMSSPMKRFVGEFAHRYNFSVELVTFKWPEDWLRPQSERQRQIWGMKILFLDVLFPLNVTRIIYVDSDQVLRADLRELWNLDLDGAPYAMTPFCDSRKETLGFQFWRQGYWQSHLRGLNYHISALFVVDLTVFRRDAVGDKLRALYHQLSADPNSLANLDQDLPNYAQHEIPIYSLPESWLWCETWCDDASKARAKTIDLCNNPLRKEPKLDMAKRVIQGELFPESWVQLDEEVKRVWAEVGDGGSSS